MSTIRFATISDYSAVRMLDPHSQYLDPNKVKNKLIQQEIIVAEEDKQLVGFVKFSFFWMTRPFIDLVYVIPPARGKRISSALLHFLEDYLAKTGCAYLFSSSEEKDGKAQSWHAHMQFTEMGKLAGLNLPHDPTAEIFYSKKISNATSLKEYFE